MILQVSLPPLNPRVVAQQLVRGGLVYSRTCQDLVTDLHYRVDYTRHLRDELGSRSRRKWRTRRVRRLTHSPRRRGWPQRGPPKLGFYASISIRRARIKQLREGLGAIADPAQETAAYWENRWRPIIPPGVGPLYLRLRLRHRHHRSWLKWQTTSGVPWAFRGRRHQDPWWHHRGWYHRPRWSPLEGVRSLVGRDSYLESRLCGLLRRERQHTLLTSQLELMGEYRAFHWGKRRRRLEHPDQRYQLFQRRRLRGWVPQKVTPRNYFQGTTREGYHRWWNNRWGRLERATLLGGAYVEARSSWLIPTLGSRVATPLMYNLYQPIEGYPRFNQRARVGARRWRLGQHPRWGPPHLEARQLRWSWFTTQTPLGGLWSSWVGAGSEAKLPPGGVGLAAGAYWTTQKWGRSRWFSRPPPGRNAALFVQTVKGGYHVEGDVPPTGGWGRVGASGVAALLSLVGEFEMRPFRGNPPPGRWITPRQSVLVRWSYMVRRWGWQFLAIPLWRLCTPLWWVYSIIAKGWCWIFAAPRWVFHYIIIAVQVGTTFASNLLWYQTMDPLGRYITHWVKDTSWWKTLGWIWTSWLLVYSSEDDQAELEIPVIYAIDDVTQENFLEEVELPQWEHPPEENEGDEGVHGGVPRFPYQDAWRWGTEFAMDTAKDTTWAALVDELYYGVGFVLGPLVDVLLRWPLWSFLEGLSLVGLSLKLESQRVWARLLRWGGGYHRGRWWKIPLLATRAVLGVTWWIFLVGWMGTILDYSTFRLELLLAWGVPWREEYYLLWWVLVVAVVSRLVAPRGVRKFLFTEVGWTNWGGLFWGVVEIAPPEKYYPSRPPGLVYRGLTNLGGLPLSRWKSPDNVVVELREDRSHLGGYTNGLIPDEAQIIWATKWQTGENYSHEEIDESCYFAYPIHLAHTEDYENIFRWGRVPPNNELRHRAPREPHLLRNNYYELPWWGLRGGVQNEVFVQQDFFGGYRVETRGEPIAERAAQTWEYSSTPGALHSEIGGPVGNNHVN